ncbi:hypothetical protein BH24ACI5_BH24ACI5_17790 [soil metagenome]
MKLLTVDVESPLPDVPPPVVGEQWVLVRLHREPLGLLRFAGRGCSSGELASLIGREFGLGIVRHVVADSLATGSPIDLGLPPPHCPRPQPASLPAMTAAVCTRNGAERLDACLAALAALDYPPGKLDLLVVDNAPADDRARQVVERYPAIRYVAEPLPGLNWARNRAVLEARGDVVAFTDDDVSVEAGWAEALGRLFASEPDADAVTGLVVADEIDVEPQRLFEQYGGFGRGLNRQYFRVDTAVGERAARRHAGAGHFGTGANMAFRRRLFDRIGLFDPALDVGTPTNGGGDLEMFFRVLKEGGTLVYEPAAIVRHRHRRTYEALRTQLANNGIGFYAFLARTARTYPDERAGIVRTGVWWLWWWNLRRLARSFVRPGAFPRDLVLAELRGSFLGPRRYARSREQVARLNRFSSLDARARPLPIAPRAALVNPTPDWPIAIRSVDVAEPLQALTALSQYSRVIVFVSDGNAMLGSVDIWNRGAASVPASRLRHAIANRLGPDIYRRALTQHFSADGARMLLEPTRVSVIVPTCERADDLRRCLAALVAQRTRHDVEIIVVDNRPSSDAARSVVRDFPTVRLIEEPRPGLSFARNAGIVQASGRIIVATDDDVIAPDGWIERLVEPFAVPAVMAVTGHVLPLELETEAQCRFEAYGGLGKGFTPFQVDGRWFRTRRNAVPTWTLGATANAAFRASVFADPDIGLMDEALGAGTPTGCSEDTYVFYKILKAGHRIVYEPSACVWHRHRRSMESLRHQIYAYSKGHVAYHLTTLISDGDFRPFWRLFYSLPKTYAGRAWARIRGRSEYPVSLILLEVLGNLAGPFALWRSRRRARRLGRTGRLPQERAHVVSLEG